MTRIYLPATMASLRELHEKGEYAAPHAHAVTPGLREWYTEGDEEDFEYIAFTRAAQDALALLRADAGEPRRRVVISADVAAAPAAGGYSLGDSRVPCRTAVGLAEVAAVHVDGSDAEPDVAAAVEALPLAESGDDAAVFTVDTVEDHELEWYDPSELWRLLE